MLSFKSRLIRAVLSFFNKASLAVKPVNYAFVRIPVRRVNRK